MVEAAATGGPLHDRDRGRLDGTVGGRVAGRERLGVGLVVAAVLHVLTQGLAEGLCRRPKRHPVLRPLGPRERGLHVIQVELERVRERGFLRVLVVEHALLAHVGLDQVTGAAGELQVADGLAVHREDPAGGAVLR